MVLPDDPHDGDPLTPRDVDGFADGVEDCRRARDEQGPARDAEVVLHVDDEQGALFDGHDDCAVA